MSMHGEAPFIMKIPQNSPSKYNWNLIIIKLMTVPIL